VDEGGGVNTSSREDIRAALLCAYDKILDATLHVPQPEYYTVPISKAEWEMAQRNGWIDDGGAWTEKAYQDFENGIDGMLAELKSEEKLQ
jgi:hypothetical protein